MIYLIVYVIGVLVVTPILAANVRSWDRIDCAYVSILWPLSLPFLVVLKLADWGKS